MKCYPGDYTKATRCRQAKQVITGLAVYYAWFKKPLKVRTRIILVYDKTMQWHPQNKKEKQKIAVIAPIIRKKIMRMSGESARENMVVEGKERLQYM
jgi:hypothetical protein